MCVRAGSAPNTQSSSGIRVVKSDFSLDAPAYTRELWTRRTVHIFLSERGRGTGDGERRTENGLGRAGVSRRDHGPHSHAGIALRRARVSLRAHRSRVLSAAAPRATPH